MPGILVCFLELGGALPHSCGDWYRVVGMTRKDLPNQLWKPRWNGIRESGYQGSDSKDGRMELPKLDGIQRRIALWQGCYCRSSDESILEET